MVEETIVTEASNIGDYIWLIIGGVALFFVIVGFIAEKSGLIKKTFGKEIKINNPMDSSIPIVPVVNPVPATDNQVIEPVVEPISEVPVVMDNNLPTEEVNNVVTDAPPVALDEIANVEQNVTLDESSDVIFDDSIGNNDDFMLDGADKIVEEEINDNNLVVNDEQPSTEEEVPEVVQNNDGDVWGITTEEKTEETPVEVNAPDLDEVANTEEDVWKF